MGQDIKGSRRELTIVYKWPEGLHYQLGPNHALLTMDKIKDRLDRDGIKEVDFRKITVQVTIECEAECVGVKT